MASFKFHFRPAGREGHSEGRLYIRVIHGRRYKDIQRNYVVYKSEWNETSRTLIIGRKGVRAVQLCDIQRSMLADLSRLESITSTLAREGEFSVSDIADRFNDMIGDTLLSFTNLVGKELCAAGRSRTARAYLSATKSILRFNGGVDIPLGEIRHGLITGYERYFFDKGLKMNTVSFYMRNLRALYYRTVGAGLIPRQESNPFESVFTGIYETRRRALDHRDMNAIVALSGSMPRNDAKRRNSLLYFLFAYHARGMSFVDLAYLKKTDIKGDTIIYKRKKTGFYLEVKVTRAMKKILGAFWSATKGSDYVFPIIDPAQPDHRKQYETALSMHNKHLKAIAAMAGITSTLSSHVARHTWATLAKRFGYGISLISEGLGHRDPKVTSIYLASFERSAMDEISTHLSKAVEAA